MLKPRPRFPGPLTQEEKGLIVGDDPSNKSEDDPNPISVKDIQVAPTQAELHTNLTPAPLPSVYSSVTARVDPDCSSLSFPS